MEVKIEGMPQPKGDKQYAILAVVAIAGLAFMTIKDLFK